MPYSPPLRGRVPLVVTSYLIQNPAFACLADFLITLRRWIWSGECWSDVMPEISCRVVEDRYGLRTDIVLRGREWVAAVVRTHARWSDCCEIGACEKERGMFGAWESRGKGGVDACLPIGASWCVPFACICISTLISFYANMCLGPWRELSELEWVWRIRNGKGAQ